MNVLRNLFLRVLPVAILALAIGGFLALGGPKPPARRATEEPTALPVRTAPVERHSGIVQIEADGVVVPLREVTLAAEVAGRIRHKSEACNEGQFVRVGAALFEIDPRDYELDVERLEREVRQAGLSIEELDEELAQNATTIDLARRQVDLARREAARLETLKTNRVVTESEHDRALRDELAATNTLTAAEGQKRVLTKRRSRLVESQSLASTLLNKATLDLSRTKIVSPVDGVVVEDKVEQDSFVAKGAPLVTIEDTSAAEVKTSLRMDEVARVWGGRSIVEPGTHDVPELPARVVFTIGDRRYEWDGTLSRQEGRGLDEKTRTLPCRVRVPAPAKLRAIDRYGAAMPALPADAPRSLLRGMFVEVVLDVEPSQPLLAVPEDAVRPSGDLLVMREGTLRIVRPRPFSVGAGRVLYPEASGELLPDDRVVTSQIAAPREGMKLVEATAE